MVLVASSIGVAGAGQGGTHYQVVRYTTLRPVVISAVNAQTGQPGLCLTLTNAGDKTVTSMTLSATYLDSRGKADQTVDVRTVSARYLSGVLYKSECISLTRTAIAYAAVIVLSVQHLTFEDGTTVDAGVAAAGSAPAQPAHVASASESAGATALKAQLKTAQAAVDSFRVDLSMTSGLAGLITVTDHEKHLHMHLGLPVSGLALDWYTVDGVLYRNEGKGWVKQSNGNAHPLVMDQAFDDATTLTLLPDVFENGVAYGAFTMDLVISATPGAQRVTPMTASCSYDKATHLMHGCVASGLVQKYSGFNDPANVVTLPEGLATAVDATPPSTPAVSPKR
jgi:hypothetical protein